jgi:Uma2 family endonuclease
MSVEEFQALPDPQGNFFDTHDLHEGEIVEVPGPTGEHVLIQERLEELFRNLVPSHFSVLREFYYTLPDQARRADVAVVLRSRREEQRKQVFSGAPEIVVEVLSDSNGAAELAHLRRECLADACQEFWIVDPFDRTVEVYGRDSAFHQYGSGHTAKLHLEGTEYQVQVGSIFSGR